MQSRNIFIIVGVVLLLLLCCCVIAVLAGLYFYPQMVETSQIPQLEQFLPPAEVPLLPAEEQPPVSEMPIAPPPAELQEQPPAPPSEPPPSIDYQGVRFSFGVPVAQSANAETVAAAPGNPADSFPGEVHPEYLQFKFNGYPLQNNFHEPKIFVYPAREYAALDPSAAQVIEELSKLLAAKPTTVDSLPFLPIWPAAQMLQAQIQYLDFKNGSGVRYLTQYGQAVWPINNVNMFYTFQGLTHDGNWYVAAIFPAAHPSLPGDDQTVPGGDILAFENTYLTYLSDSERQLSAEAAASFTPDLALLDALMQSLQVK